MLIALKTLLRCLILPPAGPLIAAAAGLLWPERHRPVGKLLALVGVGSLWLFATPIIADALLRAAQRCPPLDLSQPSRAGAIVVLGGGAERSFAPEYGGPAADEELLERVAYAAFVERHTGIPLLVSGYGEETATMRAVLERDFTVRAAWIDERSRDTFENAAHSAQLLRDAGIASVIVVTSATHAWRATREFKAAGLEPIAAPVGLSVRRPQTLFDYLPSAAALAHSYAALYELIGEPMRQLLAVTRLRRQHALAAR